MRLIRSLPLLAATLALLSGCLLVDDFDAAWKDAKTDSCLNKIGESLYYSELRRDPSGKNLANLVHGWTLGNAKFLLLKQEESDKGGRLYRFDVEHGIFIRYRLNPAMRAAFKRDYPAAHVVVKEDTVTIEKLDSQTQKLLSEIASKPDYWEIDDQMLYNPLRNPACIFEDRKGKDLQG